MATPAAPAPDGPHDEPSRSDTDHATATVVRLIRTADLVTLESGRLLGRYGLSPASFQVLIVLRDAGRPLSPSEIGRQLLVTRGTVTGLLDSLEKRGLVSRGGHPSDRRMVLVETTGPARAMLEHLLPEHRALERRILEPLSAEDQGALAGLLDRVQARLLDGGGRRR